MNFVDVAAAVLILGGAWAGYKRGLINEITGTISYLVGLILAYLFYSPLASKLDATFNLVTWLKPITQHLVKLPENIANIPLSSLSPEVFKQVTQMLHLPVVYLTEMDNLLKQLIAFQTVPGVDTLGDSVVLLVTHFIISAMSFLLIMYLTGLLFAWVGRGIGQNLLPLPLRVVNNFLGAIWGLLKNLISLALLIFMLQPLISLGVFSGTGIMATVVDQVQTSMVVTQLLGLVHKFL